MSKLGRLGVAVVLGGIGVAVAAVVVAVGVEVLTTPAWTGSSKLDLRPLASRSVVYASDGSVLSLLHAEENRAPVTLDRVPAHVVRAVLDAEDDRFFDHGAIDLRALGRALAVNVESGGVFEGGSTITQQLVKISVLNSRQDLGRKVQEVFLALRLEAQSSKKEILERYLNTVYFGNGAYGLQAAAERYFGTNVERLTMGQGILLASLIRNPVRADPFVDPGAALARRNAVIDRMQHLRHLTPPEADGLRGEVLPTPPLQRPASGSDYFAEEVKQQLLRDPRLGATDQERYSAVFKGGLSIHTTLDPSYQRMAEAAVASAEPVPGSDQINTALSSVDPATGAVRALVGGPDFAQKKFNLATTKGRPTGSAFKGFTLIAALEQGISPDSMISGSSPCSVPNPGGAPWVPSNVEGSASGMLSLTDATAQSVNCAFARLVTVVGPARVVDVAHRMGITNHLDAYPSVTLGPNDVTPLQMASAYATLAADGMHRVPYFIDRVEDRDGKVLFRTEPKAERAISADVARTATQVLTQVVQRGTGRAAALQGWTVAGKTGTSEENTNVWFVAYTPQLATAVWRGNADGNVPMGRSVFGGTYAAPIWKAYMSRVLVGVSPVGFPPPENPIGGFKLAAPGDEENLPADSTVPGVDVPSTTPGEEPAADQPRVVIRRVPRDPTTQDNPNPYVRTRPPRVRD